MSQQNDSGLVSITAAAARAAYLRVYNNSGTWATAGAANQADGVQQQPSLAATDIVSIKISNAPGTRKMVADGVITAGAVVYAGATGYVSGAGTILEGRALEAGAAAGDVIEVLPLHNVDVPSSAGVATPTVTFNGLTGANEIRLTTNLADALSIEDTVGDIIVFDTSTGAQVITSTTAWVFSGGANFTGRLIASGNVANTAGVGITGTAAYFKTSVEKIGTIIKTSILIDLTGLNGGGTADDIIGADGAGVAHLGQYTVAVNGTNIGGKMTCLEAPAGSNIDVDLWYATEATGVEDTAISTLTNEIKFLNAGNWTVGLVKATDVIVAANMYMYLTSGTATDAAFTAGIFLIDLYGTA